MSVNLSDAVCNYHPNFLLDELGNITNKQNKIETNIQSTYLNHIKSEINLKPLEKKLMEDLHNGNESFLKTSYPHTKKTLGTSIKLINKLMLTPEENKKDICLLLKYIESFYNRVGTSGKDWKKENEAVSRTLDGVGKHLASRYENLLVTSGDPDKELSDLTNSWISSMNEMTRTNPEGGSFSISHDNFNKILSYHVLNQEKLLQNYEFSVNTGRLVNLIYFIRPGSIDSHALSMSKDNISKNLLNLVSQSLNIVNTKKDNFPLYHIRCALDSLSTIIRNEKVINPNVGIETQRKIDYILNDILSKYNSLPAESELREDINVMFTKFLEDTGRSFENNSSSIFSGFLKPISEENIVPHNVELNIGYKIKSAYDFNEEEENKLNTIASGVTERFYKSFGNDIVNDDNSKPLEIIVMKNIDHYRRYGYYPFRIDTNNGGIYMEGDAKDYNNQPRIYVHMIGNDVHNFGHEIVHYLDGKYNKYGNSNEFHSEDITWWQEGLAEYISHGMRNKNAETALMNCPKENRPDLAQIIDVDAYSANGNVDKCYYWPYFVQKFLDSSEEMKNVRHELVSFLRQGSVYNSDKPSYSSVLKTFGEKYKENFSNWIEQQYNYLMKV